MASDTTNEKTTAKIQRGTYGGFMEALQGVYNTQPSPELDDVLSQAAEAIRLALEQQRSPGVDPQVLRLLARAERLRRVR